MNALQTVRDKQSLAKSWNTAGGVYGELSGQGSPGFESEKEDIYSQLPTTISEGKDFLTSGGLVDYLAKSYTKQNQALRQLNASNDAARIENKRTYGGFLQNKAGAETALNTQNLGLDLSKIQMGEARTQDKLNFMNKGVSTSDPTNTILQLLQSPNLKTILAGLLGGNNNTGGSLTDTFGVTKPTTPKQADFNDSGSKDSLGLNNFGKSYLNLDGGFSIDWSKLLSGQDAMTT
jgi:hypothetical protein